MALVARALQGSVANAPAARAPSTHSTVASSGRGQIDGLSPSSSVSFEQSTFLLPQDFAHDLGSEQQGQQQQDLSQRRRGGVPATTTNETFSALFQLTEFNGTEVEDKPHVRGPKGFGGLLTKAIGTYEYNDKLIHGKIEPRGQQMRLAV